MSRLKIKQSIELANNSVYIGPIKGTKKPENCTLVYEFIATPFAKEGIQLDLNTKFPRNKVEIKAVESLSYGNRYNLVVKRGK